jgi:hypothetical protein
LELENPILRATHNDSLLVLLIDCSCIDEIRKHIIDEKGYVRRPGITRGQNAIDITLQGLLKPRVLGPANELKEEDGLKDTDQSNMKGEAQEPVIPGLGHGKCSDGWLWKFICFYLGFLYL